MMSTGVSEDDPSFLRLIRGPLQPTILDTEQYLPGRVFRKYSLLEPYTVGKRELEELQAKGWVEIQGLQENPVVLQLTSQLSLILALTKKGPKKKDVALWAQAADLHHAVLFPVVLVHEASSLVSSEIDTQAPGTHALIFEDKTVHCYELQQLGNAGYTLWQILADGLKQFSSSPENGAFTRAQAAALQLSKCYWELHERSKKSVLASSHRTLPHAPNVLHENGMIIPQLDPIEGVLLALSHAQDHQGGWKEVNAIPTYTHQRSTSTTEVTVRPHDVQIVTGDISTQLWQRVRQFSDLDGDIFLAMLAQSLGSPSDGSGGTWITGQQILEYRGIQPKTHKRESSKERENAYRQAGHRYEDMRDIAEGMERIRDTHITVRSWKENHKRKTSQKPRRKRIFQQESYIFTISDFIQQSQLVLGEEQPSKADLAVAWHYQPGTCLNALLGGPNYRAAWLLQQALHYDPYHEQWEKRLARYFTFQLRMNTHFGGTTIRRAVSTLIDELALPLNTKDPQKTRERFEKAMHRLQEDRIISSWEYNQMVEQLPRYNWLDVWLAYEVEISADSLPWDQAQTLMEHLRAQRQRKLQQKDEVL